jgi:predicted TIM-barrel fold metal-dependent hydrolase
VRRGQPSSNAPSSPTLASIDQTIALMAGCSSSAPLQGKPAISRYGYGMQLSETYIGFPSLPEKKVIVDALVNDPPEIRWRVVRSLFRIKNREDREALIEALQKHLYKADHPDRRHRIALALQALHRPLKPSDYLLVKERGALKPSEFEAFDATNASGDPAAPPVFFPIVDFHIHPKNPDLTFLADLRNAGITHGVILATDTDPGDVDRDDVRAILEMAYKGTVQSHRIPVGTIIKHIKANLDMPTRVSNQDVADWVRDYPGILTGFGSVNMSKDRTYVEGKLAEIARLDLKGIHLLPHAQFFNPSTNANMDLLFEFCRETGTIILSHTGCGTGPFEIPELSQSSHPGLWEPYVSRYPDVKLVLAHFGAHSREIPGIWLFEAMRLGKGHRNVYADLAAVDWLLDRENVVREIRKTIGFDRVLFASDYPTAQASDGSLRYVVSSIKTNVHLTPKEKRKVLGRNAARLLDLY